MTPASPAPVAAVVTYRPTAGDECEIKVNGEQLHGRRCIGCGTDQDLVDAGHVYTATGEAPLGWPVKSCGSCTAAS